MNDAVDEALRRLAAIPDPGFASLEANVMTQVVGEQSRAGPDGRTALAAGIAAALLGVAGSGFEVRSAPATSSLSPFGASEALAPSTLLGENR